LRGVGAYIRAMQARSIRRVAAAVAGLGVMAIGAGYAFGASETVTSSPSCCTYSKASFTIDAGTLGSFQNQTAGIPHTMTAIDNGPDNEPLFNTGTVSGGQGAAVNGTQYLAPGSYHFFCEVHGPSMSADLTVTGNGAPVARPQISLKVLSKDLGKVASSGKLKLKLSAATASADIGVSAQKGSKKLGSVKKVNLAAGASRVVKLPLSSSARKALERLSSAKVKATAEVPFGAPAHAKRRLH
jgi:plastocyanin